MTRWTEQESEHLEELARTTTLSASGIGRRLGKSRNSVISRAARLGIRLPNAGTSTRRKVKHFAVKPLRPPRRTQRRRSDAPANPAFKLPVEPPKPVIVAPMRFFEAVTKGGHCTFPTGPFGDAPGPDMQCCGARVADPHSVGLARSYCEHHLEVSRQEPR